MRDWRDKDECFGGLLWGLGYSRTKIDLSFTWLTDALYWWNAGDQITALRSLITATQALAHAGQGWTNYNGFFDPSFCLAYYLKHHLEAEITWKSICEAWVKDDFEGRFWTIGIIDRMRQIMWDEPFDLTWAARPEQREM